MSTTQESVAALRGIFRQSIAEDAAEIRQLKAKTRAQQRAGSSDAPALQSRLARLRRSARARHLVYSMCRGRTWAQIERNHPDGDPIFAFFLAKVWTEVTAASGCSAAPPDTLKRHIDRYLGTS
jgi:hypothetical protein